MRGGPQPLVILTQHAFAGKVAQVRQTPTNNSPRFKVPSVSFDLQGFAVFGRIGSRFEAECQEISESESSSGLLCYSATAMAYRVDDEAYKYDTEALEAIRLSRPWKDRYAQVYGPAVNTPNSLPSAALITSKRRVSQQLHQ